MTVDQVLAELQALGDEKTRAYNIKNGAPENQYGVKMGEIRNVAKKIKSDPELAAELWKTGNLEARLLSILICKPKQLSSEQVEAIVRDVDYDWLADWVNSYIVKQHPQKEEWREKWMGDSNPYVARAGWSLTAERIEKSPEGLDIGKILDRIESEMGEAPEPKKWTMNFALGYAGINFPEHRERAIAIAEKIGAYRDYPTSKGCVSPFVPIWVPEMVGRQSKS